MRSVLRRALLVLSLSICATAVAAQSRDPALSALPGLIVDAPSLARQAGRIPGVRAAGAMNAGDAARVSALAEERAAAADAAPGAAFTAIDPLPGDEAAPARVDSGAADPDRLRDVPAPPAP